jgi:hypothetical protein
MAHSHFQRINSFHLGKKPKDCSVQQTVLSWSQKWLIKNYFFELTRKQIPVMGIPRTAKLTIMELVL